MVLCTRCSNVSSSASLRLFPALGLELTELAPRRHMLHPFAVVTALARSTTAFSNLFLALSLEAALDGRRRVVEV